MIRQDRGLVLERRGDVEWLQLNRPERLNAFDWPLRDAILEAVERCRDSDAKGMVLTGTGRGFCVGADTRDILETDAHLDVDERQRRLERTHEIILALEDLGKPSVAAVNGVAAGGGWALALAADIVVASSTARFVSAFATIGLVPDMGAMYTLTRRVGVARAQKVFLATREIDAAQALNIGAVDALAPPHRLLDTAERLINGAHRPESADWRHP